ncbi:hypothetical protein [Streptomyces sp. SID13031]|uniref:hypothetical protein n=1 Tax=Streptomyces sp. SID13031 TaxID=2706046 RepID=UPI0013C89864|nr:hypothetical protein [Streptomyces sp. SID13031]NEA33255.1 hypothetical protein [Streptomyces sp. SID13031]
MDIGARKLRVGIAALTAVMSMTAVLVAAPTATATTTAVPRVAQSPDERLTVSDVDLGRTTVTVSGLNRVAVPVTVKAGYHSDDPGDQGMTLVVMLKRSGGTGAVNQMVAGRLPRTAGTLKNGTWTGAVEVPSTANGTFKVYGLYPGYVLDDVGSMLTETPFDGPSLTVNGVHQPKLAVQVLPRVVPFGSAYKVKAAIYDSATGKPYGSRILLQVAVDNLCAEGDAPSQRLTDKAGILVTSFKAETADWLNCVRVRGKFFDTLGLGFFPLRPGIVGATPSKTTARVGTIVPVNGTVAGAPYRCPVALQRLYGSSRWRGVSLDTVRQSGRFTVLAQPPYKGNVIYRVYLPTCNRFQAGVSKSFVIRGT